MLRITQSANRGAVTLRIQGRLDGRSLTELERVVTAVPPRHLHLDLRDLRFVDATAAGALERLRGAGASLRNASALVEEQLKQAGSAALDLARAESRARAIAESLLVTARRLLGDGDEAAEVVRGVLQDAAASSADGGTSQDRLRALTRRAAVARLRVRTAPTGRRSELDPGPRFDAGGYYASPQPLCAGLSGALGSQAAAEVRDRVRDLPEEHRLALVLHDVEGLGLAEVGALLDLTAEQVGARLHRARTALCALSSAPALG